MEPTKETKRKKDRNDDDDEIRREKKSKRARSKSGSPPEPREKDSKRKRKHSRSQSPEKSVKQEKENDRSKNVKSQPPARKVKETDMLNTRTGGAYIPPARLRMMQAQITDKSSIAYQRLAWEALKKSIHGHINKINVGNIGIIIKELLKENIVRGRGLLCRSVIQAQAASPTFTNVYAALVAAVNSRFPNIGELLLKRLVIQFKRGFKRNDKAICISAASFIAHLVNQRVAHEILALELLTLLVETPSDDSVEVAIAFLKECGQKLTEVSSKGVNAIFEMLRNILHEGQLDKRVQYMIEVMFQVWKDGFKDHPALLEELELVPEEEQFTHLLMLDDATDAQDILNVFKHDEKYEENEQKYKTLSKEILGSDADSDEGSGESGSEESDDEDDEETTEQKEMTIIDNTETNLVALRRTIYLTINSSLDFEECAHKLMKMQLKPGQEVELCHMFLDCCAEQRTYEKFYGLLAQRFCNLNRIYIGPFEEIFKDSYSTAHRLDTNRLRNVSKFFAHLLFTDSISWEVLECVKLNEEDTTSSSRIYIKILFQELAEYMGLKKLNDRLKDPTLQGAFQGVFPRDNPKNTRFSINFFTTIGLGGLTDDLREHLKQMPKNVAPPPEINLESESSSDSSSSSSSSDSSDSSSSDSEDDSSKKKKKDKKKSNKEKKEKTPKTAEEPEKPKEKERWGHDGFYDNYGKDARRHEQAHERDKDNFVIPQMPRRNERRNDDRRDQRNNNEDRHSDRDRRSDDDRPRRDRDDEKNDRSRDRDDRSRKNKDDDKRDVERNYRDDREDKGENPRNEKDRERSSRYEREDRKKHSRGDKEKSSRDLKEDKQRNSRAERNGRERDSRDDIDNSSKDYREDRRKSSRAEKEDRDSRGDKDSSRNVREEKERNSKSERGSKERDSRVQNEERDKRSSDVREKHSRAGKESGERESRVDKERSSRDVREEREKNPRTEKKDTDTDSKVEKEDGERRKKSSKDIRREEKRNKKSRKDTDDESDNSDDRRDKERRTDKSKYREVSDDRERNGKDRYTEREEIRRIANKENRMEGTTRIEINGEYKKIERGPNKNRNTVKIKEKQSDSDTSDSDSSSSSSTSSSSSEEDEKNKGDGWDIRGPSVRKEIVGRYWDLPKDRIRETVERSPPRESRRKR